MKKLRRDGAGVTSSLLSDGSFDYNQGISRTSGSSVTSTHADMLGSLKLETNSSGGTTASRDYDAFGNLTSGSNAGLLGYAGSWGYENDSSGLQLLGHRWYDSFTGRFTTRDPAQDGRNWYDYAANDPLDVVDPGGLFHIVVTIGANGEGAGTLYADPGDVIGTDASDKPIYSVEGGEKLYTFPVSNHAAKGHAPFPDGTYSITSDTPRDPSHARQMGKHYFQLREDPAATRGTWLHEGRGEDWRHKTNGCCRTARSAMNRLDEYYYIQTHLGRSRAKPRITVKHVPFHVGSPRKW